MSNALLVDLNRQLVILDESFFSDTYERYIDAWPTGIPAWSASYNGLTVPAPVRYLGDGVYQDVEGGIRIVLENRGQTRAIARWIVPIEPPKRYKPDRLHWTGSYGWCIHRPKTYHDIPVGDAREEALERRRRATQHRNAA